ncbi:MAG: hypothetical protein GEV08_25865 [Acidimicrobiia bacterium]|nr:hypothetical protein [Acidimicrobiia bacterium]
MLLTSLRVAPAAFAARTGWDPKPEGLCRGDVCVPAPGALLPEGSLDVAVAADRLQMPLVEDPAHGLWALGPSSGGQALAVAEASDPQLEDRDGRPFRLSSLRGRRVVMTAWASW